MDIELKNNLNSHFVYNDLIVKIIDKTRLIPKMEMLKRDPELTLFVCNLIENIIKKSDKIDKQKLVCEALQIIFNLNAVEVETIKTQIEFLFSNNKIKKVKLRKVIYRNVKDWIKRKFL